MSLASTGEPLTTETQGSPRFFFLMCTVFKVFTKFTILFLSFGFVAMRHNVRSQPHNQRSNPHTPRFGRWSLNHWPARSCWVSVLLAKSRGCSGSRRVLWLAFLRLLNGWHTICYLFLTLTVAANPCLLPFIKQQISKHIAFTTNKDSLTDVRDFCFSQKKIGAKLKNYQWLIKAES